MLKKILASVFVLSALATFGHTSEAAEPAPVLKTSPAVTATSPILINWSWAKGTIKVPTAMATGNLSTVSCSDLSVTVSSQETLPRPASYPPDAIWLSPPKWSHHAKATGNFASGSCSYAVVVVPNSSFNITVNGDFNNTNLPHCQWLGVYNVTPGPVMGWFKVPVGGTKQQDFAIGGIDCGKL